MKSLSVHECNQIMEYYHLQPEKNIFNMKKKVYHIIINKMCTCNDMKTKKYDQIIKVIRNKRMGSYNKKNLRHSTLKCHKTYVHNKTRATSPISWLSIL